MKPDEKAKELYNKFFECENKYVRAYDEVECEESSKKCAVIAAEEVRMFVEETVIDTTPNKVLYLLYWKQVKEDIEKI